ncbi:MAG TPA: hypothetical protein PLD25_14035 [Chloroflexota bacterium]|nr:hypothetical protein [Chloroflexota bacterium]HUM71505.1 hypothetical protein [Chloroflexota bacterium]
MMKFVSWEIQSGESVRVGDLLITPQSQVFQVRLPVGGFVWHRPVRVVVEGNGRPEADAGRDSQTIPIPDITRQVLWAILGLSILVNLLLSSRRRR